MKRVRAGMYEETRYVECRKDDNIDNREVHFTAIRQESVDGRRTNLGWRLECDLTRDATWHPTKRDAVECMDSMCEGGFKFHPGLGWCC